MRNARRTALLVGFGLFGHRLHLFRRSPGRGELQRLNAELRASRDAERRRADELAEELAQVRKRFSTTLARINDLFWTVEILPGDKMTLTYLSAGASGVVGGRVREGLDAVAFREELIHPDDAAANVAFTAAMLAGEPAEVEERFIGYDGVSRWTWSRGTPRREGNRLFYDGVTTNITERHELAEQREVLLDREREQVAMLEEMHRSRDDFIALAGHELRTPLTVIQGYVEHLVDDTSMSPEQRTQLEIVVRRAKSMSDLIDDLFDLAKLDASLTGIAYAPVLLDEVVEDAVQAIHPTARQRNISFRMATEPAYVVGDRARLRRMCDNVLDNAVKYSLSGGQISVTVTREGDEAVLVVADQGIGIPSDELPHVFERLYRATNAAEGRFPGTGLGLSIALAAAEGHGGTASADNAPEGGAVFTFRLPAHQSAEASSRR
jgi:signal transduction histidine kinase